MTSRRWDRGRHPRGAGALNIQGTLGTLLRTTLHQMGVVKDAVERQARSSLGQLDAVMLQRRHREALARLGEVVWDLARHGELGKLAELAEDTEGTELRALLDELAELEERAQGDAGHDDGTVSSADWAGARGAGRRQDLRVWRPGMPDVPAMHDAPGRSAGVSDAPEAAGVPEAQERGRSGAGARAEAARGRGRRSRGRDDQAAGGIAFMEDGPAGEDDDLAGYMHEDDVPRRG